MNDTQCPMQFETATAAIDQLKLCGFTDQNGHPLENSAAFREIEDLAKDYDEHSVDVNEWIETKAHINGVTAVALLAEGYTIQQEGDIFGIKLTDGKGSVRALVVYEDGSYGDSFEFDGDDLVATNWLVIAAPTEETLEPSSPISINAGNLPANGNPYDPTIKVGDPVTYYDQAGVAYHGYCSHIWPSCININYAGVAVATSIPLQVMGMKANYYTRGHIDLGGSATDCPQGTDKVAGNTGYVSSRDGQDKSGQAEEVGHAGFPSYTTGTCSDSDPAA